MIISAAKASEAAEVLGVELQGLTPTALTRAYRLKAKECHPDHHPKELQKWARVSWAKECLTHWIKHHPPTEEETECVTKGDCRACGGTGRVVASKRGFGAPLTMQCVYCRGTGSVEPEEDDHD